MKIAFVDVTVTVTFGGVQTAVWELSKTLVKLGHQVTIFGGDGNICPLNDNDGVNVQKFPFTPREKFPNLGTRFRKLAERVSFARNARSALIQGKYDWVVLTKPFDFCWPLFMPAHAQTKFAFMSGGTDFFKGDRWLSKHVSAWLACSHFNAWQIFQRYGQYPNVMFNGVDVDKFKAGAKNMELRQQLGIAAETCVFTFAGRLIGFKGLHIPIRALASNRLNNKDTKLMIVGSGPAEASLKALANSLGVLDKVIFQAAVSHSDLPAYYSASDVGIFPSVGAEAFGITIAEAMSCGIPVVASHMGGIPEVVGNEGHAGYLFERERVDTCAAFMEQLIDNPALRKRLGRQARERIVNLFTWEASALRMLNTLENA
ncbi:glycosyltransferase family 4 protein [Leeia oryzae]|uniref:glycosyltransferase family 4 protein n=1 Tax=Leeia oryzae TaxID=356662 RepID=UPI0003723ACB|nr:glycosyltransferase family 4 protein [Leeia oryzae]